MSTIDYFFPFRYAGIDLEAASWTEDLGRTVVEHRPTRGDGAELSDRGRVPRRYVLAIRLTGTPTEMAEKRAGLKVLARTGDTRTFEHPIDGVLRCKLVDLAHRVGAGEVSFEMTLVEDLAFTRRFPETEPPDLGTFPEVEIRGEELDAAIAALSSPPSSAVFDADAATARAQTWPDRAQSDAIQDVENLRARTRDLQRELDGLETVEAYQAAVALEAYRAAYERYARTANRQGSTFALNVVRPQPLIVLLSHIYGAREAEAQAEEIARVNDVPDVSRLERGAVLTLPRRVA